MNPLLQPTDLNHTALASLPKPQLALLFHGSGDRHRMDLALVTAHPVLTDASGLPHIGPGRVALPEDERALADLLANRRRRSRVTVLPPEVLHLEPDATAWWLPPVKRPMLIIDAQGKDSVCDVVWPGLVAVVVRRVLHLVAVEGAERPTGDSAVFHAPLPNVYATGQVCTGSARLPASQAVTDIPAWNEVITATWFTHDLHDDVLPPPPAKKGGRKAAVQDNYRAARFWISRAADASPLTADEMVPKSLRLAEWIEATIDNGDAA